MWGAPFRGEGSHHVPENIFDLLVAVPEIFQGGTDRLVGDLKISPPASFLNLTRAKSRSIPVVSQSINRPMVPVGAMQGGLGVAITVFFAHAPGLHPRLFRAAFSKSGGQYAG